MRPLLALSNAIDALNEKIGYVCNLLVLLACLVSAANAMGSDAVYSGFGQNTGELRWFVKAGMTPAQALQTATTIPAKMLGHAKDLGAIGPGFYADIVAVEGDPLKDINVVLEKVRVVIKGGAIVHDVRK